MMKLLIILGNSAVGKMTVGQELMKITALRLFHNHMMIEPVVEVFGEFENNTVVKLREVIFREFVKSDFYGMIFTYMWDFDEKSEWASGKQIDDVCAVFREAKAEIYFVELVASQEVRLQRNITENRLQNKASKRNLEASRNFLINDDIMFRCESRDGELSFEDYFKLDNTNLSAEEAAEIIKRKFLL